MIKRALERRRAAQAKMAQSSPLAQDQRVGDPPSGPQGVRSGFPLTTEPTNTHPTSETDLTSGSPPAETLRPRKRKALSSSCSEDHLGDIPSGLPLKPQSESRPFSPVLRAREAIVSRYHDDLQILGLGPKRLAGDVLRDLPSRADNVYLQGLSNSELETVCNTHILSGALLHAEQSFRFRNAIRQHTKEAAENSAAQRELKSKLEELKYAQAREMANLRAHEKRLRSDYQAQILAAQSTARVLEVNRDGLEKELEAVQDELRIAQAREENLRAEVRDAARKAVEAFRASTEYENELGEKALLYLDSGFHSCARQFQAAGHPPEGVPLDFLSLEAAYAEAPGSEEVMQSEPIHTDPEPGPASGAEGEADTTASLAHDSPPPS